MEENIKVLILGTDINSYYMSRCYHELTGKKADTIGNRAIPYTNITNPIIVKDCQILGKVVGLFRKI